jgi:hypothetical protein
MFNFLYLPGNFQMRRLREAVELPGLLQQAPQCSHGQQAAQVQVLPQRLQGGQQEGELLVSYFREASRREQ